jgi:septal ring factor EnvC (AmiA/AmiB activator)
MIGMAFYCYKAAYNLTMKKLSIILFLSVCAGCTAPENSSTKEVQENNSKALLAERESLIRSIENANSILDSIDEYLKVSPALVENKTDRILIRLSRLNQHIKTTQKNIANLETQLKTSNNQVRGYIMMTDALKSEVEIRDNELLILADSISRYKTIIASEMLTRRD